MYCMFQNFVYILNNTQTVGFIYPCIVLMKNNQMSINNVYKSVYLLLKRKYIYITEIQTKLFHEFQMKSGCHY